MARHQKRTAEEARAAREEKLNAAYQSISDYVETITSGEDWKRWLTVAAKFPNYSINNRMLIAQQKPESTACMGYNAWQGIGRQVRKGEKGITILGPKMGITGWRDADGALTQSDTPIRKSDVPNGATPVRSMVGIVPVTTFDIAQTEGEPLPARPIPEPVSLDGPAPAGMREGLAELIAERGFTLTYDQARGSEDGYTNFRDKTVNISPGQSGAQEALAQEALTLAHEAGHMLMHDPEQRSPDDPPFHRGIGEIEAESLAYLIADHYGYDTAANSFPYVAEWSRGNAEAVRATAERVVTTAESVIARIDPQPAAGPDETSQLLHRAEATQQVAAQLNHDTSPTPSTVTTGEPQPASAVQLAHAAQSGTIHHALTTHTTTAAELGNQTHQHTRPTHERPQQMELDL